MNKKIVKEWKAEQPIAENYRIPSMRESYNENKLYKNGILCIKNQEHVIAEYDLFDTSSNTKFSDIKNTIVGANVTSPIYEATHRLIMYKKLNESAYYFIPTFVGKQDNKYFYLADVDHISSLTPVEIDENGFFISNEEIQSVTKIQLEPKSMLYLNISPASVDYQVKINGADIAYNNTIHYYAVSSNENIPFPTIEISSNSEAAPNQIIVEVY